MKKLEITEAGRKYVESLEFAKEIRDFVPQAIADGVSTEVGVAAIVCQIALILCGLDELPTTAEGTSEFKRFIDDNVEELNAISQRAHALLVEEEKGKPN
jgi:hypothetical protein